MTRPGKREPYNVLNNIVRVAIYCRVSTEEQVLHGYSLEAQETELIEYAKEKGYKIVGIYRDEGHSARQPVLKRKMMQELLADVEAGKIDEIIFTKLDRWFRSVGEYHKVQAILDRQGVVWKTILEDYQTETADGRLKVNIMLSVAENEADRTSERIRFVFDSKRKNKEACFGGASLPVGYKKEVIDGVKRLVKDPITEPVMNDFWAYVRKYNSVRKAGMFVNEKYGLDRSYRTWSCLAKKELYTGTYKGVEDFCPAYISREEWEYLQQSNVTIKKTQKPDRVYLFTGLIICPGCGYTLKATFKTYPQDRNKEYNGYRCNRSQTQQCSYHSQVSERKAEKYLLEHVRQDLEAYILQAEVEKGAPKKKPSEASLDKLQEKLRRLNNIYMDGNMDDDEYKKKTAELKEQITKLKKEMEDDKPLNLDRLREFLNTNFEETYETLDKEDKRRLWRSIISEIHVEGPLIKSIKFRA